MNLGIRIHFGLVKLLGRNGRTKHCETTRQILWNPAKTRTTRHANPSLLYVRAVDARDEPEHEVGDGRGADML